MEKKRMRIAVGIVLCICGIIIMISGIYLIFENYPFKFVAAEPFIGFFEAFYYLIVIILGLGMLAVGMLTGFIGLLLCLTGITEKSITEIYSKIDTFFQKSV